MNPAKLGELGFWTQVTSISWVPEEGRVPDGRKKWHIEVGAPPKNQKNSKTSYFWSILNISFTTINFYMCTLYRRVTMQMFWSRD